MNITDMPGLERAITVVNRFKGRRVRIRIFVDGIAGEGPAPTVLGESRIIYATVKASDLKSFLRTECDRVHPS